MLERWNPYGRYGRMRRLDEMMNRMWEPFGESAVGHAIENWTMAVDITEEDDHIVVLASVPGVKSEDIEVAVRDGVLTIKGQTADEYESDSDHYIMRERRTGEFFRSVRLPATVDEDRAESTLERGILSITFPKLEPVHPKKIPVSVVE